MENSTTQFDSLFSLMDYFNTEEKCLKYIIQKRWGGTPECKKCQSTSKVYYIKSKKAFKCSRKTCIKGGHISIKKGTIFQNSNVPFKKWFMAMFFFATEKKGISSIQLAKHIKVQQRTAWLMLQKLRHAVEYSNENLILNGLVEMDETQCGALKNRDKRLRVKVDKTKSMRIKMEAEGLREKANREKTKKYKSKKTPLKLSDVYHTLPPALQKLLEQKEDRMRLYQPVHYKKNVVGVVEKNIKDANGKIIKRGKLKMTAMGRQRGEICKDNLLPFMFRYIHPEAHVITDSASYYKDVKNYFREHSTINHSIGQFVNGYITTNSIENVWKQFKQKENGTYVHISWKHFFGYVCEFEFRYNLIGASVSKCVLDIFDNSLKGYISEKEITSRPEAYYYYAK